MAKMTIDEVRYVVDRHGFEYSVINYLKPDNIDDDHFAELLRDITNSMGDAGKYLFSKTDKETESTKLTVDEVNDLIIEEGLGNALLYHMSFGAIEDKELADLWKKAFKAMNAVSIYVDDYLEPEGDHENTTT